MIILLTIILHMMEKHIMAVCRTRIVLVNIVMVNGTQHTGRHLRIGMIIGNDD